MKNNRLIAATIVVAVTVLITRQVLAKAGGTDILHLTDTVDMTSSGVISNASGSVQASQKQQGGADHQSLKIQVANLSPSSTYQILATTIDDTNLTEAATLSTDANGAGAFNYSKNIQGHSKNVPGHGHGGNGGSLPFLISDLRSLEISIGGTQTVLSADMTQPISLQYLVKAAMTNNGVVSDASGTVRIQSNGHVEQLRISAGGLGVSKVYFLAINGAIAEPLTSDTHGQIKVSGFPAGAPAILDITGLSILNSDSNSVLSISLP